MEDQSLESLPDTMVAEFHHIISTILRDEFRATAKALGHQINQVRRKKMLDANTIRLLDAFCKTRNEVTKKRIKLKNERAFIHTFVKIHSALIKASLEAAQVKESPPIAKGEGVFGIKPIKTPTEEYKKNKNKPFADGEIETGSNPRIDSAAEVNPEPWDTAEPDKDLGRVPGREKRGESYLRECNKCGQTSTFVKAPIKRIINCEHCDNPLGRI